jgi:cation transport ATPase
MATQTSLQITGMDCSHCAQRLGQSLERLDGVIKAEIDEAGTATVRLRRGPAVGGRAGRTGAGGRLHLA